MGKNEPVYCYNICYIEVKCIGTSFADMTINIIGILCNLYSILCNLTNSFKKVENP